MKPSRFSTAAFRAVLAPVMLTGLVGCIPGYGADFDYPEQPVVPGTAVSLVTDEGWDNDSPMRSRQTVVDIQAASPQTLVDFYLQTYPASAGWVKAKGDTNEELCLVNNSNDRFIELVEVFPYTGARVEARPGRFLVMVSRLKKPWPDPCGEAKSWVELDLLCPDDQPRAPDSRGTPNECAVEDESPMELPSE